MRLVLILTAVLTFCCRVRAADRAVPSDAQLDWADLEQGQLVRLTPPADPARLTLEKFDPYRLADCAIAQRAAYLIFAARDVDGFCWWPTATTTNSIKSAKWENGHRDLFGNVVTACRSRGIAVGFCLSPIDQSFGAGALGVTSDPSRQTQYNDFYIRELTELCANYGPQVEISFDGGLNSVLAERAAKIVKQWQPNACLYNGPYNTLRAISVDEIGSLAVNWNPISKAAYAAMLGGKGYPTIRDGDPNGAYWAPIEFRTHLTEQPSGRPKSLDALMTAYFSSVGNGAQCALEVSTSSDGSIADADFHRAGELGAAIQSAVGYPLAMVRGEGASLTLDLKVPTEIDHLIIQEEIASGQRIQKYSVEALAGDLWKKIADGESIGHKKIHSIPAITVSQIRLSITQSADVPKIRRFYVTRTGFNPRVPDTLPDVVAAIEEPDGPGNLAFVGNGAKPAIASSAYPLEKHQPKGLNDGKYGNEHSWIPNAPNSWFQIVLGKTATIGRFKLGRDRERKFSDRPIREITIDVSIDGQTWRTALAKTDLSSVASYSPTDTMEIQIPPVEARYVKVWVNPGECCIDEFEIYAPNNRPAKKLPAIKMLSSDD